MENNVFVRPYTAVENIEGINVEFIHAGEVCRFSPFLVVEDFITSFYSLKVKERLLQPFPLDVIPRFKHYFFTSNAKVQCIATFFQREIIYDSHMFTGQTEFTPFEQVNYLRDGNLLFEAVKHCLMKGVYSNWLIFLSSVFHVLKREFWYRIIWGRPAL